MIISCYKSNSGAVARRTPGCAADAGLHTQVSLWRRFHYFTYLTLIGSAAARRLTLSVAWQLFPKNIENNIFTHNCEISNQPENVINVINLLVEQHQHPANRGLLQNTLTQEPGRCRLGQTIWQKKTTTQATTRNPDRIYQKWHRTFKTYCSLFRSCELLAFGQTLIFKRPHSAVMYKRIITELNTGKQLCWTNWPLYAMAFVRNRVVNISQVALKDTHTEMHVAY